MDVAKIVAMRGERAKLIEDMRGIAKKAEDEARNMTGEELGEFGRMDEAVRELEGNIAAGERILGLSGSVSAEAERSESAKTEARTGVASDEYRSAYIKYLTGSEMSSVERRALSVGTNSAGGYTAPDGFRAQLIEYARDFGTIEPLAFSFSTTDGNDLTFPRNITHGASGWGTEATEFGGTDPSFDSVTVGAYKGWHIALISEELLQDSAIDIEGFLTQKIGENLGVLRGTAFAVGTGSGQPTGLFTSPTVGKTTAATQVDSILYEDLIDVVHSVKAAYRRNGSWVTNDLTVAHLRKLVDDAGNPIFQPGLLAGAPDTLLGYALHTDPDVDTLAAGKNVMGFGDVRRAYFIRNAGGIAVQRLNERYAELGQVGFRVYSRVDAKTVDANAFKTLKTAAS